MAAAADDALPQIDPESPGVPSAAAAAAPSLILPAYPFNSAQAKLSVRKLFDCNDKQLLKFSKVDPFHPGEPVIGYMCKREGPFGGSMAIYAVGDRELPAPYVVFGTPKLKYPYVNFDSREFMNVPAEAVQMFITTKWNGMNLLMFKYPDGAGRWRISAKSKGSPFITNGEFGAFLDLVLTAMGAAPEKPGETHDKALVCAEHESWFYADSPNLPAELRAVHFDSPQWQAVAFELCGRREPHLVSYDFELAMKPLFISDDHGRIQPVVTSTDPNEIGPAPVPPTGELHALLARIQRDNFEENQAFREQRGLKLRYEYDHFATEGRVLYLLDAEGFLVKRSMYKIKPPDVEEVHWEQFDDLKKGLVREAYRKIIERERDMDENTVREELDMGTKEWNKFRRPILSLLMEEHPELRGKFKIERNTKVLTPTRPHAHPLRVIVVCGLPGSGKSYFSRLLVNKIPNLVRVNQDDMGSRQAVEANMKQALTKDRSVVVDRVNFDLQQRATWMNLARDYKADDVVAVVLDTPLEVCEERVRTRENHPTLPPSEESVQTLQRFVRQFVMPTVAEGFSVVYRVTNEEDAASVIQQLRVPPAKMTFPDPPAGAGSSSAAAGSAENSGDDDDEA